jgi:phosphatidylserine/phosphatidylglycerophosphate/cardiolipin synthase-like enzyme
MKLIVQPDTGLAPTLRAIKKARRSVDVLIFRLDRQDVIEALTKAVTRGLDVRVLTANTNKGGEKRLRQLELQLLDGGVTVSRTADDLVRYHGKMLIVDGRILHVYGYNFTRLDIEKSRSFGVITRNRRLLREAIKLFEDDFNRRPYTPTCERFIVSPENSRERLTAFIRSARKQLLIYDPKVSHPGIIKVLMERAKAGVDVRIIGKLASKKYKDELHVEKYPGKRLHVRAIVRDGRRAFVGSQSLRKLELEKRREIGVIVHDRRVVRQMQRVFEEDWAETDTGRKQAKKAEKKAEKREKNGKEERTLAAAS